MSRALARLREARFAGRDKAALLLALAVAVLAGVPEAAAQTFSLDLGPGGSTTGRIVQIIVLITVLSLAPSILVMMTSFTRIVVVLSFLRTALGTQQAPPNAVLISLAMFLTAFTMAPTFDQAYQAGIRPLVAGDIEEFEAFNRAMVPVHRFMLQHTRERDIDMFMSVAKEPPVPRPEDLKLRVLIPAFMISELRRAFEIGFLLFVPFLIIDMVVASVLMSMGMLMLPPVIIALPFKLIFFVLVDGWYLIAGSLVQSYGG
ncbi:MAG: flagellar type III secretion system pore protein FliP [Proteobacteria bacterium]|nr:flagellar type III secretion system pore protein FliP [Pseudomonadota bacterium]